MAYDLLVKNGRVVDGSGMPSFRGDVAVKNGKIVETGKLSGPATQVIDADGLVIAPGFVDNHCHYDAQVTWDPLCTWSCNHGATTVIFGNCSLGLAPLRPGTEERVCEFLSHVEAIPMDVLRTVDFAWESISQHLDVLDRRLGVNVGTLIGHSAVRYYVMGSESQSRAATEDEVRAQQALVREGITSGALGLSVTRATNHFDPQGVMIPGSWASEEEIMSICQVLGELGTGVIQCGAGRGPELKNRLMSTISQATGQQVVYNSLSQVARAPDDWKDLIARVDEAAEAGIRAIPMCCPMGAELHFTMKNCQFFTDIPTWRPIMLASDEEKMRAYSDPEVRRKLHNEAVDWNFDLPQRNMARNWYDYTRVDGPMLEQNKGLKGKTLGQLATEQGKGIIDAFLDLAVEENLETTFVLSETNMDQDVMSRFLTYPNTVFGLSDGGAHVQFLADYGYSTHLLGHWVREEGIMSLEEAVRRLTFESASVFGIYDRGLLRPGMAADIVVFDPETVRPLAEEVVHDLPTGAWRYRQLAEGIRYTIVNGQVLLEDGKHTGALPGRVLRNSLYHANHG